ncbi:MAG: endonuclease/exonuclease/phosphatase family protein [Candidatus Babeliales bacterium]
MSLCSILFLILSIITCHESHAGGLPALDKKYQVPKHATTEARPLNQFLPFGRGSMTTVERLATTADGVTKVRKTSPDGNYTQCEFAVTNVTPRDGTGPFRGPQYSCAEGSLVYDGNPTKYSGSYNQQKNQSHDEYNQAKTAYETLINEYNAQPASVIALANQEASKHENIRFTLMTWNCYAFPSDYTNALKEGSKTGAETKSALKNFFTQGRATVDKSEGINLQEGVLQDVGTRISNQAQVVKQVHPDVACFQELWKNDNKDQMVASLKDKYPYNYFEPFSTKEQANEELQAVGNTIKTLFTHPSDVASAAEALNPFKVDSGLLIVSKFPLIKQGYLTYGDKAGDEKIANKGALIVWFKDRKSNNVLLATTHLQSWTDIPYVTIRRNQLRELGKLMSKLVKEWNIPNPTFVVCGDFNDPVVLKNEWVDRCSPCCNPWEDDCKKLCTCSPCCNPAKQKDCPSCPPIPKGSTLSKDCQWICNLYGQPPQQREPRRLVDRTGYMTQAFQDNGVNISYNEVTNLLIKKYGIEEHLIMDEIGAKIIVRGPNGQLLRTVDKNSTKDPVWAFGWGIDLPPNDTKHQNVVLNSGLCEFTQHTFRMCIIGLGGWVNPWESSTVRDHIQLIDHIFLPPTLKILEYQIEREKAFGNTPTVQAKGWDPAVAISDHAPVYVILGN